MTVFAQLPQSEDDKIKVKLIDPEIVKDNEAVILNDWNNIRWKFSLDPNEEKKITLQYNVEYPADRELDYYSNQTQSDGSLE
jgi:predicted nucleotidyltransferase